jgi:hypothetical protein
MAARRADASAMFPVIANMCGLVSSWDRMYLRCRRTAQDGRDDSRRPGTRVFVSEFGDDGATAAEGPLKGLWPLPFDGFPSQWMAG